jgi:serine/threonine-protein phosphatase 2A regulatory subunit B
LCSVSFIRCFLSKSYSADGRYIVSRDYLTVKIWDVNVENRPVKTIPLHDYLRPMLYDLYNSDTIFDKFEVCCSPDGKSVATGSYRYVLIVSL